MAIHSHRHIKKSIKNVLIHLYLIFSIKNKFMIDILIEFIHIGFARLMRKIIEREENHMPISEDLKSVHAALAVVARSVSSDNAPLLRVACANILALAEQVEALETVPLAVTPLPLSVRPKGYAGMLQ